MRHAAIVIKIVLRMTYIRQDIHFIAFIVPNNSNIHVDTAFKKISCTLNSFGAQRRMEWIFGQEFQLAFKLFFPVWSIL